VQCGRVYFLGSYKENSTIDESDRRRGRRCGALASATLFDAAVVCRCAGHGEDARAPSMMNLAPCQTMAKEVL
jgi:hypothetical protein